MWYFAGLPINSNWINLNRVRVTIERTVKVVLTFTRDIISNRQVIYCSLFTSAHGSSVDSFRCSFEFLSIWFKLKKSTIKCEWYFKFKGEHTSISLYCLLWDKVVTVFLIQQLIEFWLGTWIHVEIYRHWTLNLYNCLNSCSRRNFNAFHWMGICSVAMSRCTKAKMCIFYHLRYARCQVISWKPTVISWL